MNTKQVFNAAHDLTRRAIKSGAKGAYREVFAIMLRVAYRNASKLTKLGKMLDVYYKEDFGTADKLLALSFTNGAIGDLSWLECFDITVDCICNYKA